MLIKAIIIGSHVPVLLSALYALVKFKQLDQVLRVFSCFLFVSVFVQLSSLLLWFNGVNNLPLLHLYVPLGFTCLTFFYSVALKGYINNKILWTVLLFFIVFSVFNTLNLQPVYRYNSYALTVESVFIIIYSLSTFIFLLNGIVKEKNYSNITSLNWINSGLFIYYLCSLIVFYFGTALTVYSPPLLVKYAWVFHAFFSVIMYTCFIVGIWKRPRS